MDLKINSFIVFVSLFATMGFSQDPVQRTKTITKVSGEDLKAASMAKEPTAQPREVKSIHSCEVSKKEAIVTTKHPDGTFTTEKRTITEKK